jgi:hypothetical protein
MFLVLPCGYVFMLTQLFRFQDILKQFRLTDIKGMTKILDYLETTKTIQSVSEIFGKERRYRYIAATFLTQDNQLMANTDYNVTGTKLQRKEVLAKLIEKERLIELDPSLIQRLSDICVEQGLAHTLLDRKTVSRLVEALEAEKRIAKVILAVPTPSGMNSIKILLKDPAIDEADPFYINFVQAIREKRLLKRTNIGAETIPSTKTVAPNDEFPLRQRPMDKVKMTSRNIQSVPSPLTTSTRLERLETVRSRLELPRERFHGSIVHPDAEEESMYQYSAPRRRVNWEPNEDDSLLTMYVILKSRFKVVSWTALAEFMEKKEKLQCQRRVDVLLRSPRFSHKIEDLMRKYETFIDESASERDQTSKSPTPEMARTFLPKELHAFRQFLANYTER